MLTSGGKLAPSAGNVFIVSDRKTLQPYKCDCAETRNVAFNAVVKEKGKKAIGWSVSKEEKFVCIKIEGGKREADANCIHCFENRLKIKS